MATAVSSVSVPLTTPSNADLQTYVNACHTAITAGGWVQTSDTGQTSLGSAAASYTLLYRMDDTLQATAPVYIKVVFNNTSSLGMQVTYGTASNGSGSLTGATQVVSDWDSHLGGSTHYANLYSSTADGFATAFLNDPTARLRHCWAVWRTVDISTGDPTADGWIAYTGDATSGQAMFVVYNVATAAFSTINYTTSGTDVSAHLGLRTTSVSPGTFDIQRTWFKVGATWFCNTGLINAYATEVVEGAEISAAPISGDTHNYLPLTNHAGVGMSSSAGTAFVPCFRWG
jgi:hypothetical protein